ncbi:MAG: dihydroorotate dehydrogenase electron transfer subunit [Spirochaetaceae bacterium]|nr:dihydroorotate dehydrogenase electron transfer subunit [Spirochaetaceae bacterium]MDT8298256.1 dihydroorotate dehydrogenase electron transfer subunit [Spirochaetaceae bacterium]
MSVEHTRGQARILSHRAVADGYKEMSLSWSDAAQAIPKPRPGQFFTLLPILYPTPILRRPFAYSDADKTGFSFIYEIRGPATRDLAKADIGDEIDWIGPLGSTFPHPPEGSRPVLVAGGIGLGPIYYWARFLAETGLKPLVILGARSKNLIPELEWPENLELRICTDDGSMGLHGTALVGLKPSDMASAAFYTCGPHPMMAAVHQSALDSGRPCWVSLEEMMACGVGACQGCAVAVGDGTYKRVCVEGPVFNSREVAW